MYYYKSGGNRIRGRPKLRWEENVAYSKTISYEGMVWVYFARSGISCEIPVNILISLRVT